jgi:drug/metabolite transporter (DMT)-like permease
MTGPAGAPMRAYLMGCALVVLGGLVLSLGVLCIRGASASDAWQYLFWRGIGFGLVLALFARVSGQSPLARIRELGGFAWVSVVAMVASQVFFVAAMKAGNTAEVFFLMSLAPLMAAVLARPMLGERIGVLGVLAIAVALGGVTLMTGLGVQGDGLHARLNRGEWLSWVLALGTALTFAIYSLATRGARREDLDAALVAVGILTALVSAVALVWFAMPPAAGLRDTALALLHGGVFLAAGLVLLARGSRYVSGVTLVMLAQAETVASPLWTYLFLDETTTLSVIAGGALILLAVSMQAADGARRQAEPDGRAGAPNRLA